MIWKSVRSPILFWYQYGIDPKDIWFLSGIVCEEVRILQFCESRCRQCVGDMLTEDVVPAPVGPYGESKIAAENYILDKLKVENGNWKLILMMTSRFISCVPAWFMVPAIKAIWIFFIMWWGKVFPAFRGFWEQKVFYFNRQSLLRGGRSFWPRRWRVVSTHGRWRSLVHKWADSFDVWGFGA